MSVHVRFETPGDVADQTYELVQAVSKAGRLKKGSNEVTKAAERGNAKLVVMAEDVNPPELLAHIPLICEEKGIPYAYVPSQEFLGKEAGMSGGSRTASIAIIEVGRQAEEKFGEVMKLVESLTA